MNVFDYGLVRRAIVTKEHIDNIIATRNYKEFSYEECGSFVKGIYVDGVTYIIEIKIKENKMTQENKYKSFNLEQALAGKPVVTRDGRIVEQLTKFDTSDEFCIFGVVDKKIYSYLENGNQWNTIESEEDLFMAPEKKWVNVYYINGVTSSSFIGYDSEEAAIRNRRMDANESNTKTICFEE